MNKPRVAMRRTAKKKSPYPKSLLFKLSICSVVAVWSTTPAANMAVKEDSLLTSQALSRSTGFWLLSGTAPNKTKLVAVQKAPKQIEHNFT
jgi:hypothetical protein